jgi:ComF family protein
MFRRLFTGLLNLIFPATCTSCRSPLDASDNKTVICAGCLEKIKKNTPPFCLSCGRQLEKSSLAKTVCRSCIKKTLHFDRAFSPCVYEGVTKDLIHKFKYRNKEYLGEPLSKIMIEFIHHYRLPLEFVDCIIPVPLSSARLREREFNQSEILASHIAGAFNKPLITNCLRRHRHTKRQTEIKTENRAANVTGSFSVTEAPAITNKTILLIDDVLTTGATSSEAAHALKEAGARIVFVLTVAN